MGIGRRFIQTQARWCEHFDVVFPRKWKVDGNREFTHRLTGEYLFPKAVVYDIGGGKQPLIARELKDSLGLRVVGVDIDQGELAAAPPGCYDRADCADIQNYKSPAEADIVICQALLEHVRDSEKALRSIAGTLKPGGVALIFVPSKNAVFARLNRIIPERLKRMLLYTLYPQTHSKQGFPAFYNRCTPAGMVAAASRQGLQVEAQHLYFQSKYFSFLLPLYAAWRLWQVVYYFFARDEAAETFTIVLRKPLACESGNSADSGIAA